MASAQGGNDIGLNNLNQNLAAPKFVSVETVGMSSDVTGNTHSRDKLMNVECLRRRDIKKINSPIFMQLLICWFAMSLCISLS